MDTAQRIFKNTSLLFISQIISYIFVFFYTVNIARFLGADGFGLISFAIAFSTIFSIFADLGLSTLTVREVSRNKLLTTKYLRNVLGIKILLTLFAFGLIVFFINLFGYPEETILVVYLVSLSVMLTSLYGIFYSIFQAHEKMEYQSIGQILNAIIMFFGIIIAITLRFDVIGVSIIYLISSLIILIYNLIIYQWIFSQPKLEFDKKFWAANLKESWPYGLSGFSVMLYTYIDSVILSLIQGNEVVGWYNAAYKLVLFLVFIPSTINLTIFPAMSKFYISSQNSLRFINEKYFKFMLIIGIPLGIGTTILADRIILIIFGTGYSSSIIALQILIWAIVFTFAGAAFVRLLEATNKQLLLSKITGISVFVNIILNLILIPKFSYVGASLATLLTEIILILMIFRITNKLGFGIKTIKIGHYIIKTIFASIVMGIFIFYFKNYNLVLLISSSSLIYLSTLFVVKGIDQEDILLFKRILNKD